MNYAIYWVPTAEAMLTRIWLAARDRINVRRAADTIDARLERNPNFVGESRKANVRVTFDGPLGVYFHVDDARHLVTVLRVYRIR
jgi:hypothetical protein